MKIIDVEFNCIAVLESLTFATAQHEYSSEEPPWITVSAFVVFTTVCQHCQLPCVDVTATQISLVACLIVVATAHIALFNIYILTPAKCPTMPQLKQVLLRAKHSIIPDPDAMSFHKNCIYQPIEIHFTVVVLLWMKCHANHYIYCTVSVQFHI